jgi:hypothetical protein
LIDLTWFCLFQEDGCLARLRDADQQMQLAVEEGEMRTEADRRNDDEQGVQLDQLMTVGDSRGYR